MTDLVLKFLELIAAAFSGAWINQKLTLNREKKEFDKTFKLVFDRLTDQAKKGCFTSSNMYRNVVCFTCKMPLEIELPKIPSPPDYETINRLFISYDRSNQDLIAAFEYILRHLKKISEQHEKFCHLNSYSKFGDTETKNHYILWLELYFVSNEVSQKRYSYSHSFYNQEIQKKPSIFVAEALNLPYEHTEFIDEIIKRNKSSRVS
ncbi:hypothetical protein [Rheinheimera maricola]|uniref:Uncharacterized protein n=1 Tax=Rheinheimera maricola TaxID=2793282 RepID=A0ABS7XBT0_9GAMM|nr:hypothetical protein [Rheinheimera maricola]MBZ9612629.1 hypothetical protein [Rheinheimera maricola]